MSLRADEVDPTLSAAPNPPALERGASAAAQASMMVMAQARALPMKIAQSCLPAHMLPEDRVEGENRLNDMGRPRNALSRPALALATCARTPR